MHCEKLYNLHMGVVMGEGVGVSKGVDVGVSILKLKD
jgi:hypothetical protein